MGFLRIGQADTARHAYSVQWEQCTALNPCMFALLWWRVHIVAPVRLRLYVLAGAEYSQERFFEPL